MADHDNESDDDARRRQPDPEGFAAQMAALLEAEPFVPFMLVTTSGDRYEVTSRFSLAFKKDWVSVFPPKQAHIFLRSNQIVAVEIPEDANP